MSGVFVSYRRSDAGLTVHDIVKALETSVDAPIFFDLDSISAGQNFNDAIAEALQRCSVVVVALGKDWFGVTGSDARRIDDEDDLFRQEIETALKTSATIIPVLIDRQEIPDAELPATIRALASLQWHRIRIDDKDQAITNLVGIVKEALFERHQARLSNRGGGGGLVLERYRPLLAFDQDKPKPKRHSGEKPFDAQPSVVISEELLLRINAALATDRPLFLVSAAGLGRTSVARTVASRLKWRYYEYSLTTRSQAKDLLYSFDAARRLNDAQMRAQPPGPNDYIEPGLLWWAFDPVSARRRGALSDAGSLAVNPSLVSTALDQIDAVLMLDGIDRIPPADLRDWFYPILARRFFVPEAALTVSSGGRLLIVATADSARALPRDLRRRFATYQMPLPSFDDFVRVGLQHFRHIDPRFVESVATHLFSKPTISRQPTLVELHEFLDVLAAVERLEIEPGSTNWRILLDTLSIEI